MRISIITATYNRAKLLPILYQSLIKNYATFKDFEWLVMDDGSTDNTKKLIAQYKSASPFKIIYKYHENQGKQREINMAIKYVTGDIIIELDSDDHLLDNVLKNISSDYESLTNENIYGILYKRKIKFQDTTVNPELNNQIITLFDIHNTYNYDFDMFLTFKTSIRKKYFYQLEKDEKFITEARLYYYLDTQYQGLLFKDYDIIASSYQEDGYSKNITKLFKKYPQGYYAYFNECLTYIHQKTKLKRKLYFLKQYILFSYLIHLTKKECIKKASKYQFLIAILVIPGYLKAHRIEEKL